MLLRLKNLSARLAVGGRYRFESRPSNHQAHRRDALTKRARPYAGPPFFETADRCVALVGAGLRSHCGPLRLGCLRKSDTIPKTAQHSRLNKALAQQAQ
jgi:hypothetical protein